MRTLNKALCLVLVVVMVMGLAAFSVSADAFPDQAKVTAKYDEAVGLLHELKVMIGDNKGNFDPTKTFTRAEAATMMVRLLGAEDIAVQTTIFADVPTTHWANKYVAYCYANGIIKGVSATEFDPDSILSGTQWALMLLRALGYHEGDMNYELYAAKTAKSAGLLNEVGTLKTVYDNANGNAFTREEAAQIAFNTLTSTMVDYPNGVIVTTPDGTTVNTAADAQPYALNNTTSNYTESKKDGDENLLLSNGATTNKNSTLQFCERYFPKLKKDDTVTLNGASGYQWKVDGDAVSAFVNTEKTVSTTTDGTELTNAKTTGLTDKSDANANFKAQLDTAAVAYVNGTLQMTGTTPDAPATVDAAKNGNGVKVDLVDTDDDGDIDKVYYTTYDVLKVKTAPVVKTNSANSTEYVYITFDGGTVIGHKDPANAAAVKASKVTGYSGLAVGDVVTYTKMDDGSYILSKLTPVVAQATASTATTLTVGGEAKKFAKAADTTIKAYTTSPNVWNADVNFYYDAYGYLVRAEAIEEASNDFLMVLENSTYATDTFDGAKNKSKVVFQDGSEKVITVAKFNSKSASTTNKPAENTVYSYVANDDGTYKLNPVASPYSAAYMGLGTAVTYNTSADSVTVKVGTGTITKGVAKFDSTTANADTKFVVYDNDAEKWVIYTGYANVPSFGDETVTATDSTSSPKETWKNTTDYAAIVRNGYATVVFVNYQTKATPSGASSTDTLYLLSTDVTTNHTSSGTTYTLTVIADGKKTTVVSESTLTDLGATATGLYKVTYKDGTVTALDAVTSTSVHSYTSYEIKDAASGVIEITDGTSKYSYSYASDLKVYGIEGTDVTVSGVADYVAGTYKTIIAVTQAYGKTSPTAVESSTLTAIYLVDAQ